MYWGQVAKNFAVNGPFKTSFAMTLNAGPVNNLLEYDYNFHFLPAFALLWALFFKVFGIANWVSRLMAMVFSLGAIAVFYKIAEKFLDRKTAIIASFFWLVTPMFIYFGKMPVHEIPLMFFVLLSFWFYLNKKFWPMFAAITAAELLTWPGFFLVPAIALHAFLTKSWNKKYLLLFITAPALFGIHLLHDHFVTNDFFGGGLREIFLLRTSGVNMVWYVRTLASWSWAYYFLLVPLAAIGLVWKRNRITILFLMYAVIYPLVFRDAASRHDYLLIYFWPFLALSTALVIRPYWLVALLVVVMIAARWNFIMALEDSSLYRESARIGEYAGANTMPTDKVQVVSFDPSVPFDGWFASYYANRPVIYTLDPSEINPSYKTIYYYPGGRISLKGENK